MYTIQFRLNHLGCLQTLFVLDVFWQNYLQSHPSPAVLVKFLRTYISASPFNLSLVIVDLKSFLISQKVLIDRSHTTLVTGSVAPFEKQQIN